MFPYKLANAASHQITVTATATRLLALINTAGGTTLGFPYDLSVVQIAPEDGDIRWTDNGINPTATEGKQLVLGGDYTIECAPTDVRLIRTGGANVVCNVRIGWIRRT